MLNAKYWHFTNNLKTRLQKSSMKFYQKPEKMQEFDNFNFEMNTLFDIFCEGQQRRTSLEKLFCIKMTPMEWSFLQVMRTSRKQYCKSAVDRRWRKAMERKTKQKKSLEERQKQILAQTILSDVGMQTESETNNESTDNDDATFVQSAPRVHKQSFIDTSTSSINDALPDEYWHIRVSAHII